MSGPRFIPKRAPAAMRDLAAWVVWRLEPNGTGKPRKVPYYANGAKRTGRQGGPADRAALVTFAEALAAAEAGGYSGVGFAHLPGQGVLGLDFDHCVANGAINPEVAALVAGTYAEISPSGTGVRAYLLGSLDNAKSAATAEHYGAECFTDAGFTTFTGRALPAAPAELAPIPERIQAWHKARFGGSQAEAPSQPLAGLTLAQIEDRLGYLDASMGYSEWLAVLAAVHAETEGSPEGLHLVETWSARSPKYVPGEVEGKWSSLGGRAGITGGTLLSMARAAGAPPLPIPNVFEDLGPLPAPKAPGPLRVIERLDLANAAQLDRVFWVASILPARALTLLGGHGGVGKSTLSLVIAAHLAAGVPFCGLAVKQARVLVLTLEDDGDTVRYRLRNLCDTYGLDAEHVERFLRLVDGSEAGPLMMEHAADGTRGLAATKAMAQLRGLVAEIDVLVVDNASDGLDASENDRRMVRGFVRALQNLVASQGGAVLLLAHVAKNTARGGMDAETYSGSTAWHNSARYCTGIRRWPCSTKTTPTTRQC